MESVEFLVLGRERERGEKAVSELDEWAYAYYPCGEDDRENEVGQRDPVLLRALREQRDHPRYYRGREQRRQPKHLPPDLPRRKR